jgi:F420H(2)-dependent quinone reductase
MTIEGDYQPGAWDWVNRQVEAYEASGGREANMLQGTTMPIIVITTRGHRSGKVRKFALMRVEHDGEYALVASKGGMPADPGWAHNLRADPQSVTLQDGPDPFAVTVREVEGEERERWWERSVAAYPDYAEYQKNTERLIPVFVATPTG